MQAASGQIITDHIFHFDAFIKMYKPLIKISLRNLNSFVFLALFIILWRSANPEAAIILKWFPGFALTHLLIATILLHQLKAKHFDLSVIYPGVLTLYRLIAIVEDVFFINSRIIFF